MLNSHYSNKCSVPAAFHKIKTLYICTHPHWILNSHMYSTFLWLNKNVNVVPQLKICLQRTDSRVRAYIYISHKKSAIYFHLPPRCYCCIAHWDVNWLAVGVPGSCSFFNSLKDTSNHDWRYATSFWLYSRLCDWQIDPILSLHRLSYSRYSIECLLFR